MRQKATKHAPKKDQGGTLGCHVAAAWAPVIGANCSAADLLPGKPVGPVRHGPISIFAPLGRNGAHSPGNDHPDHAHTIRRRLGKKLGCYGPAQSRSPSICIQTNYIT